MKRYAFILFPLLLLFLVFQQCKKEEYPPLVLLADITPVSDHGLSDGSINLTVEGGLSPYSYSWSNEKTTEDLHDLAAGTYCVTVTDAEKSSISDSFVVTQPAADPLVISLTCTIVTTHGGNDGTACVGVTGGVSPYSYLWSNGSDTECINGLIAGVYTVTVTDAESVQAVDSIEIMEPGPDLLLILPTLTHPSETGAADGSIYLEVAGGHTPYSFAWSNGDEEKDLFDLPAGEYSVTVTDAIMQTATESMVLIDSLFDSDGNSYAIKIIGDQTWIQSNLRVTHAPDGSPINHYTFNDDPDYLKTYGRLYSWNTAMNGSTDENAQGLCPCGWHIPGDAEFQELEIFLGMTPEEAAMENTWRGTNVGTQMKMGGGSGYNAALAGRCLPPNSYSLQNYYEYVWTSTEYGDYAWRRCLSEDSDLVGRWNTFPKTYGFSVRCVKDD